MAFTNTLPIPQTPKNPGVSLANADGTALKTLYTAGANGAIVRMANICSSDTSAQNLQFTVSSTSSGGTDRPIGTVPVGIAAGTNGTAPSVNALDTTLIPSLALDQNSKAYLLLEANAVLKVKSLVAVTAAKSIDIVLQAEEY